MPTPLPLISQIKIGTSAVYPARSLRESYRKVGPADQARESYEEVTWELECLTRASSPTDIRTLNQTLRADLNRRGVDVVLTEHGVTTTLSAAASLPGYPQAEHVSTPEISYGGWQSFTLRVTDRRPIADGSNVVEHTYQIRSSTNAAGGVETRHSGEVRLANGQDALAWVTTNVLGPAASAAAAMGLAFVRSTESNADGAWCRYEYTSSPVTSSGGITDLLEASRDDRTTQDTAGRGRRVISGYAKGAGASAWANAQALAVLPAGTVLVAQEGPTPASVPDGRISFRYEYAVGKIKSGFPGIYILDLQERIVPVSGGRAIEVSEYMGAAPVLRRGVEQAYVYRQESSIRFIGGTLADHGLTALFDTANQSGPDLVSTALEGPIRVVSITREFVFDEAVDPIPTPRTLEVL